MLTRKNNRKQNTNRVRIAMYRREKCKHKCVRADKFYPIEENGVSTM